VMTARASTGNNRFTKTEPHFRAWADNSRVTAISTSPEAGDQTAHHAIAF